MELTRTGGPLRMRAAAWAAEELRPGVLARSMSSGVLIYVLEIIVAVSFASLVFSGKLAAQLPYGLAMILAGDAVICAVVALLSSFPGSIAVEQDAPSAIQAIVAVALVAALPAGATAGQQFSTVVVMIAGTAIATGVFFLLLGNFKLGRLVHFIPYPVMGGFLAGTGYLLSTGAIGVMAGVSGAAQALQPPALWHWLPGAALGAGMLLASRRTASPLLLPAGFVGGAVVFYLAAGLTGTPLQALTDAGWLLGPFPAGTSWQFPFNSEILRQADWLALAGQIPALAPVAAISVIAALLNVSGLEVEVRRDIEPDHELVAAGWGNVLGGLAGGLTGYHAISFSIVNFHTAGSKRLPGLLTALLLGVTVLLSASILNWIPRMLLGALLFFIGLSMLDEWVFQAWRKFARVDFAVIGLILAIVALSGFMEGIAAGLILTIVLFVIKYSRTSIVKYALNGASYHSRVARSATDRAILKATGAAVYIVKLQGFIFFGTANALLDRVKARLNDRQAPPLRAVALDLALVSGLDATGALAINRIQQLLEELGAALVISSANALFRAQLEQSGVKESADRVVYRADLDHAVEWCENRLLTAAPARAGTARPLSEELEELVPSTGQVDALIRYMQRRELAPGEVLLHEGDVPDLLYFVESGQVTSYLEEEGREPVRLQTVAGGLAVGELGFYLGIPRTTDVVADEPSVVYSLSRDDLEQMERNDPGAASVLHRVVIRALAERVVHLTGVVEELER